MSKIPADFARSVRLIGVPWHDGGLVSQAFRHEVGVLGEPSAGTVIWTMTAWCSSQPSSAVTATGSTCFASASASSASLLIVDEIGCLPRFRRPLCRR
jgi:hypothetical protein